jgi:replicative DNA helicase
MNYLGMRKFGSLIEENEKKREANGEKLIPFGISFLDDSLEGILPQDLILVTAQSGVGKTEVVTQIALNATKSGKRVYFLALESYKGEVEDRLLYKACVDLFYKDKERRHGSPDYLKWSHGKQISLLEKYKEQAKQELKVFGENMMILDGGDDFGIEDFEKIFIQAGKEKIDLFVLDHLHYMEAGDENENQFHKRAVKKMQELVKRYGVPMLLVAHIRKRDRRQKVVAPSMDDIHGSSDIFKMATKMISLASGPFDNRTKTQFPTYVRVAKCRYGSARDTYIGLCVYDITANSYHDAYDVGRLTADEEDVKILEPQDRPHWYRNRALK